MTAPPPAREVEVEIGPLALEGGGRLERVVQRVSFYGAPPRADGANVVYVAHALTGSGRILEWWSGFVGPGRAIDTDRLAVIGASVLGGCYGSTGPASPHPDDGRPYGSRFPVVSVGDMVRAQAAALARLRVGPMAAIVGGSLGAMQALRWTLLEPERFRDAFLFGADDAFSAMAIGLNALSRAAILRDPAFAGGDYPPERPPREGLRLARMIAMTTYKSEALFEERFGRRPDRAGGDPARDPRARFDVEGYLEHQGEKFVARMDAGAYLALTRAMDLFDVSGLPTPARPTTRLTFVGIDSDRLFPAARIARAADRYARAGYDSRYLELASAQGHDAFLVDVDALRELTRERMLPLYADAPPTA